MSFYCTVYLWCEVFFNYLIKQSIVQYREEVNNLTAFYIKNNKQTLSFAFIQYHQ